MILRDHFGGVFFFKQKTAYEMRISDWSSDVCSSDLPAPHVRHSARHHNTGQRCERAHGRRWIAPDYGETRVGMAVPDLRKAAPRETFPILHIGAVINMSGETEQRSLSALRRKATRRGGDECVSTCRSRVWPCHLKKDAERK